MKYTDDSSMPPWELKDPHEHRDRLRGKDRRPITSFGIVDRLTWQSRLVRLIPKVSNTISKMYFTQGRSADKSAGDPMKVYRQSKEEGTSALSLSGSKAAWRDAHSILMIRDDRGNERRPECFNTVARAKDSGDIDASRTFVTNIVGLATAPNKAGKFLLWRHERMPIPAALLSDVNLIERLGSLLGNAENAGDELMKRTSRISRLYLSPGCEAPGGRRPDRTDVAKIVEAIDPRPAYWARLEEHFFILLKNLPLDPDNATSDWRQNVKREAQHILEESVRSLGTTARAIQAVARVHTDFNDNDLESPQMSVRKARINKKGGTNNEP
jgi:CRISPR system Cascade subunit CasA